MMSPQPLPPAPLPLLAWKETAEIERLEAELRALHARILAARPHSHARVELEARARILRARQLSLECELRARR